MAWLNWFSIAVCIIPLAAILENHVSPVLAGLLAALITVHVMQLVRRRAQKKKRRDEMRDLARLWKEYR